MKPNEMDELLHLVGSTYRKLVRWNEKLRQELDEARKEISELRVCDNAKVHSVQSAKQGL